MYKHRLSRGQGGSVAFKTAWKCALPLSFMARNGQEHEEGPKDTSPELALRKSYDYQEDKDAMRLARLTMTKYNLNR